MAAITFQNVSRVFPGTERPALSNLELAVNDGEFLVMVGPSGCGKSTTLRLLAGLDAPTSGRILIDGQDVTGQPPQYRDTAMVFQNYALYPHMNVRDNVGYPLKVAGVPTAERDAAVQRIAHMLGLEELLHRKPGQLSGGQRQRVAMGRALVRTPKAFLLDEPLSNLDASLRLRTRTQISEIASRLGVTTLYVTHDQSEAMTMADRLAVLHDGTLQQLGTPEEIYNRPANTFVASFIGNPGMNLLVADVTADGAEFGGVRVPFSAEALPQDSPDHSRVIVGVRPEDFILTGDAAPGLAARVISVESHGATHIVYAQSLVSPLRAVGQDSTTAPPLFAVQLGHREQTLRSGDRITLAPHSPQHVHFFDVNSTQRI